ncbi:MAG: acyltransferase [Myxococcota bacterium]
MVTRSLQGLHEKVRRDLHAGMSPARVRKKAIDYAKGILSARWYLRAVDECGRGVRTIGKPRIENHGFIAIADGCLLRSMVVPVELVAEEGAILRLGREVRVNYGASLGATASVLIGDRVRIGPHAMIVDSAFHDLYRRDRRPPSEPVVIEDDVWVGARAVVLPGVRIGRASVIGTGAVVTKDVPAFTVAAGVPAQVRSQLDEDRFLRELEQS